ncbi:MAG TPA: translation initiation factor IF-2 [Acidimicrobiales bacterium]|nr:translation initiation factor IF-2 [Acidimicrobiales bacterium]
MPKKIRVYELARELGMSNKEALDLALALGIGVKSHSSSIEDAQADRVRRKADSEGLRRAPLPEEPATEPAPPRAEPRAAAAGDRAAATHEAELAAPAAARESGAPVRAGRSGLVTSRPASETGTVPAAPAAPRAPTRQVPPTPPSPSVPTRPGAASPPSRPASPAPAAAAPGPIAPAARVPETPVAPPHQAGRQGPAPTRPPTEPPEQTTRPPAGTTGRPIPPPPTPPRSASGRPIPPPPGRRAAPGARPPGAGTGAGRPSPGGRPAGGRPVRGGPGGGGGFGGRGPGGPGAGGFGGRPGAPGAPPGFRGGPGGRGRPPLRRPRRRRRNLEELEPTQLTTYTPSNAPVPDTEVIVERGLTPRELGPKLNRSAGDVIRFLFLQGEVVTATQSLTDDMVELFAAELGAQVRLVDPGEEQEAELQAKYFEDEDEEVGDDLRPRPPIVTVMGHVDHGKTLLLDRIRSTNVVAGEAGGITQHIGAYQVEAAGHLITFIDTPGHEAFTAMRARGAQVTDIVVLVVAADDGVMPQTVEAIDHARAADVPIVVAVNKIDRPDADVNRVLQQLSERGLVPESWGGDTIVCEVSALENVGIDELLEQIVLVAELEELRASPEGRARGAVLEANLEAGRGPVATVVVMSGTLRVSDGVVAGAAWGKVKALVDDTGEQVKEAPPSTPVQVLGFSEPPSAGDEFRVTSDQTTARTIGEARERRFRVAGHAPSPTAPGAKLEDLFEQIQRGETATLNLILKADVQGTLEAISDSLRKLERPEVKLSFVHRGVGGITENDVQLAGASNASIIGFDVRPDRRARELAEERDVEIRTYEIIYKLLEDIEAAMVGMLAPEVTEVVTGEAEVRAVFRVPRVGAIAGCYVRDGVITRGSKVRFLRDGVVIWKGSINSLRRFKDDAREVQSGFECGIGLSDFQDLKEGDIIETYEEREVPRT